MRKNAEDIISLPIEINDRMGDSKFRLVHIASQRVRDIGGGDEPLVTSNSIKDTTVALEESLLGSYRIITGEQASVAKEEMRKRKEQEREEQLSAIKEEEIRKELSAYLNEASGEGDLAGEADAEAEPAEDDAAGEPAEENGGEAYSEE